MEDNFLNLIQANIKKYGYHITIVSSDTDPRYAYTIGLSSNLGFELILAGGYFYLEDDLFEIIDFVVKRLTSKKQQMDSFFKIKELGMFKLSKVHNSWNNLMLLGVFDYYACDEVKAFQILPDEQHFTFETPDMSVVYSKKTFPIWKWLDHHNWNLSVPKGSMVVTNLQSLQGEKITEVMRWEVDSWEMFAGSGTDVEEIDMRVLPMSTLLGLDNTLLPALNLGVGKGIWRDPIELDWYDWN